MGESYEVPCASAVTLQMLREFASACGGEVSPGDTVYFERGDEYAIVSADRRLIDLEYTPRQIQRLTEMLGERPSTLLCVEFRSCGKDPKQSLGREIAEAAAERWNGMIHDDVADEIGWTDQFGKRQYGYPPTTPE